MDWVTPAAKSQKPLLLENNWPSASAVLPALIRRKDLDGQVAIKINVANRLLLNWKQIGPHRLDFDPIGSAKGPLSLRTGIFWKLRLSLGTYLRLQRGAP